jgi:hypothetical protein
MPKNQINSLKRVTTISLELLKPRLHRFLLVMLVLLQVASVFYAIHSLNYIVKPNEWYFWTTENTGPDRVLPNHKIILDREFNAPNALWTRDPLGVCDQKAIGSLGDRHINPAGVGYKGIWLCNNAGISRSEFDTQVLHFKEKVDEMYSAYHGEICSKILTSLACGFLGWLSIVFSALTIRWIKGGKAA